MKGLTEGTGPRGIWAYDLVGMIGEKGVGVGRMELCEVAGASSS